MGVSKYYFNNFGIPFVGKLRSECTQGECPQRVRASGRWCADLGNANISSGHKPNALNVFCWSIPYHLHFSASMIL